MKYLHSQRCVILNRWDDDFAAYHEYLDHRQHRVAIVTTPPGLKRLSTDLAVHIDVVTDLSDTAAVTAAVRRCEGALHGIDRIIAFSEFDLLQAAAMRRHFGVQGHTPEQVARFRDKTLMKDAILAAGLRAPRYARLADAAGVEALITQCGFPLMVKPRLGAASAGCHRIDCRMDFDQLPALNLADYECEEFVDGQIYHVDGLVKDDIVCFIKASRYMNTCYDFAHGQPLGSILLNPGSQEHELSEFSRRCLTALGLKDGTFHLEVIGEGSNFCFLEIGARVGGGEIPFLMRDLFGVDLYREWMRIEFGFEPQLAADRQTVGGGFLMLPESVGKRIKSYSSPEGQVDELYQAVLPPLGHAFDGKGGYDSILGRFRYRGRDEAAVEMAIHKTLHLYRYELEDVSMQQGHSVRSPEELVR